jgi:hypothetical protein
MMPLRSKNDMSVPPCAGDLALSKLSEAVKARSPRCLNLSRRAVNALSAAGVTKIGQLVSHSGGRFLTGQTSNMECENALTALAKSVRRNGDVDWVKYAEARGLLILPCTVRKTWAAPSFIEVFPETAETAVRSRFGMNALTVLKSRLLIRARDCPPLESVAKQFGATKEAVRLIERDLVHLFTRSVWYAEYEGCRFRFRPEFVQMLHKLISAVQSARKPVYSFLDWQRIVRRTWGVEPQDLACAERLLLSIAGLRKEFVAVPAFFSPSEREGSTLRMALREANRLLTQNYPSGLSLEQLREALRERLGAGIPTLPELSQLVSASPNLEKEKGTARYRTRAECLTRSCDHYERILRATAKPIHYLDIWREARRTRKRGHASPRRTQSALSGDARFVSIARSGYWGLAEWSNVETRSTPQIAADILKGSRHPMSGKALFALIAARRPVKTRSLRSQLAADARFARAARGTWRLADESACERVAE